MTGIDIDIVARLTDEQRQIIGLAVIIADGAARADIECYAHMESSRNYDLTRAQDDRPDANPDQAEQIAIVQRAAEYIDLRSNALPYRLVRTGDFAWFEARS